MIKNDVLRYTPFYINQNKNGHVHKLRLVTVYVCYEPISSSILELEGIRKYCCKKRSVNPAKFTKYDHPLNYPPIRGRWWASCRVSSERPPTPHVWEGERESETETGLRLTEGSPQSRSCTSTSLSRVSQWTSLSMYHPRRTICLECLVDGTCVAVFAFCMHKCSGFVSSDLRLDNLSHLL